MSSRRQFIIDSCRLCLLMGTAGVAATLLDGCKTIQSVKGESTNDNKIKVPLTSFAATSQVIVHAKNLLFDIFVNKKTDGNYTALLMQCTHQDQPLTPTTTGLNCPSHGSKFDLEGNVVLSPATRRLIRYPVETTETDLLIVLTPLKD